MEASELQIQRLVLPLECLMAPADQRVALAPKLVSLAAQYADETDLWVRPFGPSSKGMDVFQGCTVCAPRLQPMMEPSARLPCVPKKSANGRPAQYILTGATGGVGGVVLEWLIKDQGLSPEQLVLIRRVGSSTPLQGPAEHCKIVEVTSMDSCEELLAAGLRDLADVAGIFHLAGILDDGIIGGMTEERMRKVSLPKCGAAAGLLEAAAVLGWPVRWIINFSSTSSLFGYAGQVNYCAANALLDHLAAFGSEVSDTGPDGSPPCRVIAINWGPWGEVGMAKVGTKAHELALKEGDHPLSNDVGIRCLAAVVRSAAETVRPVATQFAACDVEWHKSQWKGLPVLRAVAEETVEDDVGGAGSPCCAQDASKMDPDGNLKRFLLQQVRSEKWEKAEKKTLNQLGLDSLEMVQLRNAFNNSFKANVPLSVLTNPSSKLSAIFSDLRGHIKV